VCLATPVLAQSGAAGNNSSVLSSAPQSQPGKDGKTSVPSGTDQSKPASDPAAQTSAADPMSDYNVNGNAVGDGLGVSR
jgi:hypothetical protein